MEVIEDNELVMPMSVPQKLGDKSTWFVKNPVNIPEFNAMVNTNVKITKLAFSDSENPNINKDRAPPQAAGININESCEKSLLVLVKIILIYRLSARIS